MDEIIELLEELLDSIKREGPLANKCVQLVRKIAEGDVDDPRLEACRLWDEIMEDE